MFLLLRDKAKIKSRTSLVIDILKEMEEDNLLARRIYYYFFSGVYLRDIRKYSYNICFLMMTPFPQKTTFIILHGKV